MVVRKAVIPAAGLGTRFLPATKVIPKEMIPILDKPMIQMIIEEAALSGIEEIILITAKGKTSIEDHFDCSSDLDRHLLDRGKHDLLEISRSIGKGCKIFSVRQKTPLGLGHAVLMAEPFIKNEPFAVLLPDEVFFSKTPCIKQLIDIFDKYQKTTFAVMEVAAKEVEKYGIVDVGEKIAGTQCILAKGIVEKPSLDHAPSKLAIPGRYVLKPSIFNVIRNLKPGRGNEIQLADALHQVSLQEGCIGAPLEGDRYDAGDRIGWLGATLRVALQRPELKAQVLDVIKQETKRDMQQDLS